MWQTIIGIGLSIIVIVGHFFVLPRLFQDIGYMPRDYPREREDVGQDHGNEAESRDPTP